jgi:hypothetical protein
MEYQGREPAARFLTATAFRLSWTAQLIPARANGQPAFDSYARDPHTGRFSPPGWSLGAARPAGGRARPLSPAGLPETGASTWSRAAHGDLNGDCLSYQEPQDDNSCSRSGDAEHGRAGQAGRDSVPQEGAGQ